MIIPDYTLLQNCGKGAYGQVWLAKSQANRLVALKYVANSQAGEREFEGLINYSQLPESPHLIRILHLGKLEDGFFYTMELADGQHNQGNYVPETLAARLKRDKKLPVMEVMELATALLDALCTLHDAGMVHRDVKPENILYVNGIPKLSDVGLVRSAEQTVSLGGTLGFIPPERLQPGSTAAYDASDDLYALGKVLYCALTGNAVEKFPSFPVEMINNNLCCHLNQIILKACGNESERFRNTWEFLNLLQNGTEPETKTNFPYKTVLLFTGFIATIVLSCLITSKLVSAPAQPPPEIKTENAPVAEKKQQAEISRTKSEVTPAKTAAAVKTKETEAKQTAETPAIKQTQTQKRTQIQKRIVRPQPDEQGGVLRKAGEDINWKNLPWNPFHRKKAKKWEPEDFGGLVEAFVKNSVELYIRDPYVYYHPAQGDGLHPDHKPGELKKGPVYARLLCSEKEMGHRFWDNKQAFDMPEKSADPQKKYGWFTMNETLPEEYVIRCKISLIPETSLPVPTIFTFATITENGPFSGFFWDLVLFPNHAEIPKCAYTYIDEQLQSLNFRNPGKTKKLEKKSFVMEVVRTNQIVAIYLDNVLCQYVPSGTPGGIFKMDLHSLNAVKIEDWEVYELNPQPPYLPSERYRTPDKRPIVK